MAFIPWPDITAIFCGRAAVRGGRETATSRLISSASFSVERWTGILVPVAAITQCRASARSFSRNAIASSLPTGIDYVGDKHIARPRIHREGSTIDLRAAVGRHPRIQPPQLAPYKAVSQGPPARHGVMTKQLCQYAQPQLVQPEPAVRI